MGPKGLPVEIVRQLNAACNKALQEADLREKITSQGNEVAGGTPEEFQKSLLADRNRWAPIGRAAGIKLD